MLKVQVLVQHVRMLKNEDRAINAATYHSARYKKTLSVSSRWLKFYGMQAKVEIVGFLSCISAGPDWFIGLTNDRVQGQGYFGHCT